MVVPITRMIRTVSAVSPVTSLGHRTKATFNHIKNRVVQIGRAAKQQLVLRQVFTEFFEKRLV